MRLIIKTIVLSGLIFSQGFLHVENGEIVDGSGNPVLLRVLVWVAGWFRKVIC